MTGRVLHAVADEKHETLWESVLIIVVQSSDGRRPFFRRHCVRMIFADVRRALRCHNYKPQVMMRISLPFASVRLSIELK